MILTLLLKKRPLALLTRYENKVRVLILEIVCLFESALTGKCLGRFGAVFQIRGACPEFSVHISELGLIRARIILRVLVDS